MLSNKIQNKKHFLLKEIMWLLPAVLFATFIITLSAKTKVLILSCANDYADVRDHGHWVLHSGKELAF